MSEIFLGGFWYGRSAPLPAATRKSRASSTAAPRRQTRIGFSLPGARVYGPLGPNAGSTAPRLEPEVGFALFTAKRLHHPAQGRASAPWEHGRARAPWEHGR